MRNKLTCLLLSVVFASSVMVIVLRASAGDVKMVGVITKIQMAADGKSSTATLKDNKSGQSVTLSITDDLTLDKFKV